MRVESGQPASTSSRLSDETRSSFLGPSPPQSSFAFFAPTEPFGPIATCLGFGPLRDFTRPQRRFLRGLPTPRFLRPQVFATSRRFAPLSRSRACFIPLPRPGFRSFKGFSLRAATPPHRREPAPLLFPSACSPGLRPRPQHNGPAGLRQLRGLSPRGAAFARTQLFTEFEAAPFVEFFSLGSPFSPLSPAYPAISALDVSVKLLRLRARF
jgi:hypothetical protein